MKTIEVTLYEFNELSQHAQRTAIDKCRETHSNYGYHWDEENLASLRKFADIFDCSFPGRDYSDVIKYDGSGNELTGLRLRTFLINNYGETLFKRKYLGHINHHVKHRMVKNKTAQRTNNQYAQIYSNTQIDKDCNLTGYFIDHELLTSIWNFIDKPDNSTMQDLVDESLHNWGKAVEADHEYQDSDEYIAEKIEANKYEFTADGIIY
jgi:hypothetical protein